MRTSLLAPLRGLRTIGSDTLRAVLEAQRLRFSKGGAKEQQPPEDGDAPPQDEVGEGFAAAASKPPPEARFDPAGEFRRPSDFVRHLARKFEEGELNPKTGKAEPRPLKRDQALFIARFAAACNAVWDDDQKIKNGTLNVTKRRTFNFLLMGQGGSGKTAIVQKIVLPAMDGLFPVEPGERKATLIVCAKWSQADNISTEEH